MAAFREQERTTPSTTAKGLEAINSQSPTKYFQSEKRNFPTEEVAGTFRLVFRSAPNEDTPMLGSHVMFCVFHETVCNLCWQSKGDFFGAEEHYFRATLADPKDGEVLSQYAKLVWQLHRDRDIALNYFERAALAAPENSHVLAAYASFLWEINYDDDEPDTNISRDKDKETEEVATLHDIDFQQGNRQVGPQLNLAAGFGIGSCGFSGGMTLNEIIAAEDYYKSMIQENPNSPLVLRNYAQFLDQCKGDLRGAEEFYSRAVLADGSDGEIISQYANFIWQLHHDQDKASSYFKRAVQASPGDRY
ncbi:hypothetical protein RND71_039136 [Anisodus tanguticus]|uniref:TmcB/TmcC TPR repeats domain-containing protein n=1 Tax=Anisodus tanguticus TaxID=243964 RepID=A0AAE1QW34_9SOLA|nr:hypothetical protein RND71_039136 [Anisodus tanguticus]